MSAGPLTYTSFSLVRSPVEYRGRGGFWYLHGRRAFSSLPTGCRDAGRDRRAASGPASLSRRLPAHQRFNGHTNRGRCANAAENLDRRVPRDASPERKVDRELCRVYRLCNSRWARCSSCGTCRDGHLAAAPGHCKVSGECHVLWETVCPSFMLGREGPGHRKRGGLMENARS